MVSFYLVGSARAIPAGQELATDPALAGGCSIVVEGAFELFLTAHGTTLALGVLEKGDCFSAEAVDAKGRVPYAVKARERATVLEMSATAVEALPPASQRSLRLLATATAARPFNGLLARHVELAARNAELASRARSIAERANRVLGTPQLRATLDTIPALPVYAGEVALKLLDERTHANDVVESIKNNPSVAGLVLKRVNSAYYGLETKVSDYYRALLLLGTNTVYRLILESGIESVMPDVVEVRESQLRAHVISVLAYEVALVSGKVNPLLASTLGLLHNIGESVALLVRQRHPDEAPLVDCVEPAPLGAAVLAAWGLPERVYTVVERQREPEFCGPERIGPYGAELAILWVALGCHEFLFGGGAVSSSVSAYMEWLGLRETSCAAFCRETLRPALLKNADHLPAAVRRLLLGSSA